MKTSKRVLTGIAIALVAVMTIGVGTANASLLVDIGYSTDQNPQSGWEEWNTSGSATETATFSYENTTAGNDLGVTLTSSGTPASRNYGLDNVTDPGNLAVPDVWADLYFISNSGTGSMTLTLDNLLAGQYEISFYSYADDLNSDSDTNDDSGIADISVNDIDTGVNATLLCGFSSDGGSAEWTAAELNASITIVEFMVANDGDQVAILFDGLDTNTGSGDSFGINGFELIPEPASLGLFGIACGALWFVRRRFRGMAS